jgi:hypothetical protein
MPFVPARPSSLNHLSDEVASLALDKHLGDFVKAAKELNINRSDLRRLCWHNPRILDAAHERMDLFRSGVRSKIIGAIYSGSAKRRRWGYDAMFDCYEFRNESAAYALLAPAPRRRVKVSTADIARSASECEQADELAREYAAELDLDRRREMEGAETLTDAEPARGLWLDLRDVDPELEVPASAGEGPELELDPVPVPVPVPDSSGLPVWLGPYPPPPLIAHQYQPFVSAAPQQQPQREHAPELRRRMSRGGWR